MSVARPKPVFTVDQYLAFERSALDRHEYLDGEIFGMAGESPSHGRVSINLASLFVTQLRGKPCEPFTKDTKVRSGPVPRLHLSTSGLFSYPDIVVVCGGLEFHDDQKDVILNPTVITEVLSPSTEEFDRGEKFRRYQLWNPTLRHYLLVWQDKPLIECFSRQDDDSWLETSYSGLEAVVPISSIGCVLNLAAVYERLF
jgi:Uma2 family endonuclease